MPHLYLPTEHTDADLVLAADVAAAVASADLYVTWTIESGAGAPEIEAVVREETVQTPGVIATIGRAVAALWRAITGPPIQPVRTPRIEASRAGEPTA